MLISQHAEVQERQGIPQTYALENLVLSPPKTDRHAKFIIK